MNVDVWQGWKRRRCIRCNSFFNVKPKEMRRTCSKCGKDKTRNVHEMQITREYDGIFKSGKIYGGHKGGEIVAVFEDGVIKIMEVVE